jgi:hypothetical protein
VKNTNKVPSEDFDDDLSEYDFDCSDAPTPTDAVWCGLPVKLKRSLIVSISNGQ